MANMSYCRFQNTYRDLQDCVSALNDNGADSLSDDELAAAKMMMQLCDRLQSFYDEVLDEVETRKEQEEEQVQYTDALDATSYADAVRRYTDALEEEGQEDQVQ